MNIWNMCILVTIVLASLKVAGLVTITWTGVILPVVIGLSVTVVFLIFALLVIVSLDRK